MISMRLPARGPWLRRPQDMLGGGGDFGWLRHPPDAGLAGLGHLADIGTDGRNAVAAELQHVAAGGGVIPHQRVHRRRQQDWPVGGQQDGGGKIVGVAMRHFRHQVRGRGRHHDQVALARQADMAGVEFALGIEQVGVNALMRQRACRQRCDELLRRLCQYAADGEMAFLEPPDQVQRLVGGDAAADDQGDARLAGCADGPRRGATGPLQAVTGAWRQPPAYPPGTRGGSPGPLPRPNVRCWRNAAAGKP